MTFELPKSGHIEAFAAIVDINGLTRMVQRSEGYVIAQFVGEVLAGGIGAIERYDGHVVGFMGDAFFAVLPTPDAVFSSCVDIAKSVDEQCAYISGRQSRAAGLWAFSPGGPSLKIGIEYGSMGVSDIGSMALGTQPLLIGAPINYASRICGVGVGNRCHFGPVAAEHGLQAYASSGPETVPGKLGEPDYVCYQLDLSKIWREGRREARDETFLS